MQEQVKEILEMTKNGQISVDEASRLIEALNNRTSAPEGKKSTGTVAGDKDAWGGFKMDQDLDSIGKFVEKLLSIPALKKSIDTATKAAAKVSKSHHGTRLSQFEEPTGESFSFEDNSINLSTFSGTSLSHSSFCDNSINASSIQNLAMVRSEIVDGSFNATSLDQFHLSDAKIDGTSFSGSRVRECTLEQSEFTDASFSGCSLREVVISQHSKVTDCSMSHLQIQQSSLKKTRWSDCSLNAVTIETSHFDAVEFADVALSKISIIDCVIKNVVLSDTKLQNKELRGLSIDGNDAFLKALGSKA